MCRDYGGFSDVTIELRNITKRFGDFVANESVSLTIRPGEILALLGENGAGKTTIMNVLCGLLRADEGEILFDDKPVYFSGPKDSINAGIGMVHQHFMLVPVFSVAENVVLGVEPTGAFDKLDIKTARARVSEISSEYSLVVDPDAIIEQLPVGIQQRVEIIKVLFRSAEVLIFDEPTAVLTPQEVKEFFAIVRSLCDSGKAVVFISHKLGEVIEIADRISVMRQGKIVGEGDPKTMSQSQLAEMMVGRPVELTVNKGEAKPTDTILEVTGLQALDQRLELAVRGVDLKIRAGEIVGIAGVQGNGQSELAEAITGLREVVGGTIHCRGENITRASARHRHHLGMAHVPEDRQRCGIIGKFPVTENMVLNSYYDERYSSGILLDWQKVEENSRKIVNEFDVRTPSLDASAGQLSGGNQQKLVIARELSRDIELFIAVQPTRGVDVGSIEYIHSRIIEARDAGVGVLIISTELDEVLALSDRILVMYRGEFISEFSAANADVSKIGLAMAGVVS